MKLPACANDGAYRTVESTRTIVFLGEDRFAVLDFTGNMELHDTEAILWKSVIDDVFVCLRPTQAHRDINAFSNN